MRSRTRRGAMRLGIGWMASAAISIATFGSWTSLAEQPARDPVGAEELFRQGVAAKNRDDWRTACEKFQKSFDLEPAVSTQYKIASCFEHEGKLASALYGYQSALKMNRETRSDQRRRELEASIRAALGRLEARVPRLRIIVTPAPPGLELLRDGDSIVPASVLDEALPVDPGEHTVIARAPGYADALVRVEVREGRSVDATLTLRQVEPTGVIAPPLQAPTPTANAPQQPAASSATASQTELRVPQRPWNGNPASSEANAPRPFVAGTADHVTHSTWSQKHTAYVVGAASVATLLVAGYFGLRTLDYVGDMDDYKRPDGKGYTSGVLGPRRSAANAQTAALVLAGVGTVLGAVGVGLYVKAPQLANERAALVPGENAGTLAGISACGRW